ncbi:MAG: hypothetical protein ACI3XH_01560 [Phascolarctobacterium sp.]
MQQSLYDYIQQHIDEDGVFTEGTLPDGNDYVNIVEPGQTDAFYYTADMPSSDEDASIIIKDLRAYLASPSISTYQKLYNHLKEKCLAEYADPFIAAFDRDEVNETAFSLARRLLYNARHREPLKFAFLLFGLYSMQHIEEEDPELWRDLVTTAHCEEFTFAFLYSCRVTNYISQKAVWELLGCTKGWGKVFAIIDCRCPDDDHRRWLLQNGPDIDVEYPPLSVKLIQATQLDKFLAQPVIDYPCYKSAVAILGNYMMLLLHYKPEAVRENYNLTDIDLYGMLKNLLHHALYLSVEAEDMLDMITIATSLRNMQDDNALYSLTPNQVNELIAACDKMVYATNWEPIIASRLFEGDQVNYQLADLAYELELDIWQQLYDFWLAHPMEYTLLPYLLSYEGGNRSDRVLAHLTEQLPLYASDLHSLVVPLHYLRSHPGKREIILCAALSSMYELLRSCACDVLEAWGPDYLSQTIIDNIYAAMRSSTDDLVQARLIAILQGKKLDIEAFLQRLKKKMKK